LNATVDALSRKAQLATLEEDELSVPMGSQMQGFHKLAREDQRGIAQGSHNFEHHEIGEGRKKTRKFWMDNGFLYFGDHIYVPKSSNLWKELLRECHDSPWGCHPGKYD
jgi:hypothetical protein